MRSPYDAPRDAYDVLEGLLCLLAQIGIGIRGEDVLLDMAAKDRKERAVAEAERLVCGDKDW